MDASYIKSSLAKIQSERGRHGEKFATNPAHANCDANFDRAIENLERELAKVSGSDTHDTELPKQVGDGMLYNDIEGELYDVAEEKLKKQRKGAQVNE